MIKHFLTGKKSKLAQGIYILFSFFQQCHPQSTTSSPFPPGRVRGEQLSDFFLAVLLSFGPESYQPQGFPWLQDPRSFFCAHFLQLPRTREHAGPSGAGQRLLKPQDFLHRCPTVYPNFRDTACLLEPFCARRADPPTLGPFVDLRDVGYKHHNPSTDMQSADGGCIAAWDRAAWGPPIFLLGASHTAGREQAPRLPVCLCLTGSPLPSACNSQGSFRGMKLKNTPWLVGGRVRQLPQRRLEPPVEPCFHTRDCGTSWAQRVPNIQLLRWKREAL